MRSIASFSTWLGLEVSNWAAFISGVMLTLVVTVTLFGLPQRPPVELSVEAREFWEDLEREPSDRELVCEKLFQMVGDELATELLLEQDARDALTYERD